MRITSRMMTDTVIQNVNRNQRKLDRLQAQLTSGKKVSRPSDDPPAVHLAMAFRAARSAGEQYLRTIDGALAWANATDAALGSATDLLQKARELALQGANDTLNQAQRDTIAGQIDSILNDLVSTGNSNLRGQRLFAGFGISSDPMVSVPGSPQTISYLGDSGQMLREIDVNQTISINTPGTVFASSFTALIGLRDDLRSGNLTQVRATDIPGVDAGLDQLLAARAGVGATVTRLESARDRHELIQVRTEEMLTKVEDVDFAQAISEFTLQQSVYQAALQAGSKAIQPSLFEFLR